MSITVTLTQEQLNVVSKALSELPFKDAAPVLAVIQQQLIAAARKAAETPTPAAAATVVEAYAQPNV